ncbi:LacI family DNA-binding transcriptional regulator [Polymorphospora sp. A560]|uniref:LacI family DNA-binding transcriptional regulator n=1 Tax=Polymorphospora sp. A560 TaxID=3040203 RepID=UPI0038929BDF
MGAGRATQADVARLAGVSQATVSLVLKGDGNRVGDDTRRRVLDAINKTNYSANPVAQRLAGGRNQIVGVFTYEPVFPRGGGDFYHPFLIGIEGEAEQWGCDLLLFTSAQVEHGRRRLSGKARAHLGITDGCLLLGHSEDKQELVHLLDDGLPFVFVGRRQLPNNADLPYIGADYVRATHDVVRLFLTQGHERIGFVGELSDRESILDRLTGYRAAMRDAGLRPTSFDPADLTPDEILDVVLDNRLTGLVLAEAHRAEGLRTAAARRGLTVPADLSIAILGQPEIAVDSAAHSGLNWSGFRIPRVEMGAQALRLLVELIGGHGDTDRHRLLPCRVETGQTVCAPAPN